MTPRLLFIAFTLLFVAYSGNARAADCAPADIHLYAQADVDNFQTNHGPGCDTVTGELFIGAEHPFHAPSDINNLDGLVDLVAIQGGLVVEWNPLLSSIDGLANIVTIESRLEFSDNDALTSLNGLASLTDFGGGLNLINNPELVDIGTITFDDGVIDYLRIHYCWKLTDISPLSALTSINLFLSLSGTRLEHIDELSGLSSIGTSLFITDHSHLTNIDSLIGITEIGRDVLIGNNTILDNLEGLAALQSIGRTLYILDSYALESLAGLRSLSSIGGHLALLNIDLVEDLDGLSSVSQVGGGISILGNAGLTQLSGFNALTNLQDSLSISGNSQLTSIDGFNGLVEIGGALNISRNSSLETLDAFESLSHIGADLNIERNSSLTQVDFFDSLQSVAGGILIESNDSLQNLDSLSSLTTIGSSVTINYNDSLENVDWLGGFNAIEENLLIQGNPLLSDLGGLSQISSVGGDLTISNANNVENFDDLSNLEQVGGSLSVLRNESLQDLHGLSALTRIAGDLSLWENNVLTDLEGLNNVSGFDGNLSIAHHAVLDDISALGSITRLTGLELLANSVLDDLSPLSSLTAIAEDLFIRHNSGMTNLQGLGGLESIGGSLRLLDNPAISDLGALSNLNAIDEFLVIRNNDQLVDLNGLHGISQLGGGIAIEENDQLADISAFSSISKLGQGMGALCALLPSDENYGHSDCSALSITENNQLESLSGLDNLLSAHGHVIIKDNPGLAQCGSLSLLLDEFDNGSFGPGPGVTGLIPDVNGFVSVQNNASACLEVPLVTTVTPEYCQGDSMTLDRLSDVENFQSIFRSDPGITCEKVIGTLFINVFNGDVEDLDGLEDLTFIGGDLVIRTSLNLVNIEGLSNVTQVGRDLRIDNTWDLPNLDGLSGVTRVGRDLIIIRNGALSEIGGLADLASVGRNLAVSENEFLSDCQSLEMVLDGVDDGAQGPGLLPIPDVGLGAVIMENAEGCNSVEEIAPLPSLSSATIGSWYDPARTGTGFMLHGVNENLAVAYYYGFDNDADRFWLIGVHEGAIEWDQPITFDASYVTGGSFEDFLPENVEEQSWGTMALALPSCDDGVITLTGSFPGTAFDQSLTTSITRLAPTAGFGCFGHSSQQPTDGLTGSWYDPSTSGQGFAVHKIDTLAGVVYFYGFDDTGSPLWLIGVWDGVVGFGSELMIQMNQVTGGTFETVNPDQIVESPWGTLRIRFDSCTTGWAELSGDDGSQEFNLVQLAGSTGLDCPE